MKLVLIHLLNLLILVGCGLSGEDEASSGLFSGHKKVTNLFVLNPPTAKTYLETQTISFSIIHPFIVTVTGGVPSINIDLGGSIVSANYISGSGTNILVFQYTVVPGDNDTDGVEIGTSLSLNGATIKFDNKGVLEDAVTSFAEVATSAVFVDTSAPAITSVLSGLPGLYLENKNLFFNVIFDEKVFVGGVPLLVVDIGGTVTHFLYVAGNNSTTLLFKHTILSTDLDLNGVDTVSPLLLSGGTIKDSNGINADLTYADGNNPLIQINGHLPWIDSTIKPIDGSYVPGQTVDISLHFTKNVNISGAPRLSIDVGGSTTYATYQSGTGSDTLLFKYTVTPGDVDTDGIEISALVDLNGGAIDDGSGNDSELDFDTILTPLVIIDAPLPEVVSITLPANGTYLEGDVLYYTLNFNTLVDVSGFPLLSATLDATDPALTTFTYNSGSGTTGVVMRYVVGSFDEDYSGIVFSNILDLNGGTIQDVNLTNANLDITTAVAITDTTGIIIDGYDPTVISVTAPSDDTYILGENIDFSVQFRETVVVTGTPQITFDLDSSSVTLDYVSGSNSDTLVFRYTVADPDIDINGIAITASDIALNGGTIVDLSTNPAVLDISGLLPNTTGILVDGDVPIISSITGPIDSTYLFAEDLDFPVNFDDSVIVTGFPRIEITLGTGTVYATYLSGSGTNDLIFRYSVTAVDEDTDGITTAASIDANGGSIQDTNGNDADLTFTIASTIGVLVDGIIPTITSITIPADGTFLEGQTINFTVNFSENITISGVPSLDISLATGSINANYISGSGTNAILYSYVILSSDEDLDGIALTSPLSLNAGSIQDIGGNNATLTFLAIDTAAILVDGVNPTVTSITAPANGSYILGEKLDFSVQFRESVIVTGTPQIDLDVGGNAVTLDYVSGTTTDTLLFRYTIGDPDIDTDGISITASDISLNGGTIVDVSTNPADLDISGVLPNTTGIFVDGDVPIISSIIGPSDSTYMLSSDLDFTVSFDENVIVTGTPRIEITLDTGIVYATYLSGSTTSDLIFRYTIAAGNEDTDGIIADSSIDLNSGSIKDAGGNNAILTYTLASTAGVLVDGVIPTISSITPPASATYLEGETISFTVNFTEAVTISGAPSLDITFSSGGINANYLSGSGTAAIIFSYTILNSDEDLDGIVLTSPLALNGGTIQDTSTNNVTLGFTAINTTGIIVDVTPVVSIVDSPDINNANKANYTFSGACSEYGEDVDLSVGGTIFLTPICIGGAWTSGSIDVTGLGDGTITLLADHQSVATTSATQASVDVDKNTFLPLVTINATVDIDNSNETDFIVTGTCTENSVTVTVDIEGLPYSPLCSGGTWTTGSIDVSSLGDGVIAITADHSTATQASLNINKNSAAETVTITAASDINASNETSYILSGTCSVAAAAVTINIGGLPFSPACSGSNTWTTGSVDVSSLGDGVVAITADHSTATQAADSINKTSSTPTIDSLASATILSDSIGLDWSLVDPGGFTIDDYIIEYKPSASGTWLTFSDGVSINQFVTISSLTASTNYDFRVAVAYDTTEQSDWSTAVTVQTQPDSPFIGPYSAMNVAGATTSVVSAHFDSTTITLNGGALTTLNAGDTFSFASSAFDIIDADKAIFTAGKLGVGASGASGNTVWMPSEWAGKSFSFNATRSNPQILKIFAIEDTYIEVKQGATVLDSLSLTAGNGGTLTWSVYGSYQVNATGSILAFHYSNASGQYMDPKPVLAGSTELIGFPSSSMTLTANFDSTNYNFLHSSSVAGSGSLNKSSNAVISPEGTTSLYQSESLLISADKLISGASFADSNGYCAAPFIPTSYMKKKYVINVSSDFVAFASKASGTIEVRDSSNTLIETLTLVRSGANTNAPYRVRRGNTPAGYRFISTVKVGAWYQPNTNTGAANEDETILYGTND